MIEQADSKFRSRKFILSMLALAVSSVALFTFRLPEDTKAAGAPDGAAAGGFGDATGAQIVSTTVRNYETCHAVFRRLRGLQSYMKGLETAGVFQ